MKTARNKIVAGLFICFASTCGYNATWAQQPQIKKISYNEAINLALNNRSDLQAFQYAKKASRNAERIALAGYLPQVQMSTTAMYSDPNSLLNTSNIGVSSCSASTTIQGITFNASQLLLKAGGPLLDYKIAKESTAITQANEIIQRNQIRFSTENSFFNVQKLLIKDSAIKTQDRTAKTVFSKMSGQNMVGLLNPSQWLSSVTQYSNTQADVINYQNNLSKAIAQLERDTATPIDIDHIDLNLESTKAILLKPLEFYLQMAAIHRPELDAQESLIKQAHLLEKKYRKSYVPTVSLTARAEHQKQGTGFHYGSWYAGLDFSWHFDGGSNANTALQNRNFEVERCLQKRDLELSIQQEVTSAHLDFKTVRNRLKPALIQLEQAKADLNLKQKKYEVGNLSASDYAQSQLNYEIAQYNVASLKIEERSTYQKLLFVCGYPPMG